MSVKLSDDFSEKRCCDFSERVQCGLRPLQAPARVVLRGHDVADNTHPAVVGRCIDVMW